MLEPKLVSNQNVASVHQSILEGVDILFLCIWYGKLLFLKEYMFLQVSLHIWACVTDFKIE